MKLTDVINYDLTQFGFSAANKNEALDKLTENDLKNFYEDGVLPKSISEIMDLGSDMRLYFKNIPNKLPTTGGYLFEDLKIDTTDNIEEDNFEEEKDITKKGEN